MAASSRSRYPSSTLSSPANSGVVSFRLNRSRGKVRSMAAAVRARKKQKSRMVPAVSGRRAASSVSAACRSSAGNSSRIAASRSSGVIGMPECGAPFRWNSGINSSLIVLVSAITYRRWERFSRRGVPPFLFFCPETCNRCIGSFVPAAPPVSEENQKFFEKNYFKYLKYYFF